MRKLFVIYILFLIIISQNSCSNRSKENDVIIVPDEIQVRLRDNKKLNDQYERIFAITDFNDISFIYPIGIELSDDLVFIQDRHNIHVFDKDGNYQNSVGNQGMGPGEFQYLKDFSVDEDKIYCLDKGKMSISIFSMKDFDLISEKRIPRLICENISLENISVYKGDIYISGFAFPQEEREVRQSLLYKLDKDMTILNSYFRTNDDYAFGSVEERVLMTGNVLSVDEGIAYMGMFIGDNLLYAYDLNKNNYLFKVSKAISSQIQYNIIERGGGSIELMSLYNTLQINVTDNYIILAEEAGSIDGKQASSDYYNNLSFYSKDGNYLFSFEDKDIPYSVYGIYGAVEELTDGFHLYLVSPESSAFYKYYLKKL